MSYPPPRHLGPTGEPTATFRPATTPPDLAIGAKSRVHYLATGATTTGDYGLHRWDLQAIPNGPGAHFHKTFSESFYILEGTISLYNGEKWLDATPGDFLYVPPGGVHAFSNNSDSPASMLVLYAPGAPREPYFERLAEIVASGLQLSPEEWDELYAEHDQHAVDTPERVVIFMNVKDRP